MTKERTRQKLIARGEQLKKGLKWWQKEFPNDKDLPLRMFVNGEYHATFNDLLILKLIESYGLSVVLLLGSLYALYRFFFFEKK